MTTTTATASSERFEQRQRKSVTIQCIIASLKQTLPSIYATSPKEVISVPLNNADYQGFDDNNTLSVDGFLYSHDDVDVMQEDGILPTEYCLKCGSQATKPLSTFHGYYLAVAVLIGAFVDYVSHSASVEQLKYIFSDLVLGDLKDKVVVDIGSRLGPVLYVGELCM